MIDDLEVVNEIEDHVYELFVERFVPERDLGMIQRKHGSISLTVADTDLNITQSLSLLNSGTQSSTTGAMAWKVSPLFSEWLLDHTKLFSSPIDHKTTVVEMGAGVSGIVACTVGPKVGRYTATDQKHILKLLKTNIEQNVDSAQATEKIKVEEFDWEYCEDMIDNIEGIEAVGEQGLVIACDTIYNEYLIPHFVRALKLILQKMGPGAQALVAQQLRSEEIMEGVLVELNKAQCIIRNVPDHLLSQGLVEGYAVHHIQLSH